MIVLTRDPEDAPNKPELVTIDFVKGVPTAVNGKKLDPVPDTFEAFDRLIANQGR